MKLLSHRKQFAIIFALTLLAGVGAQTQPRFVAGKNSGRAGTQYVDRQVIVKLADNVNASAIDAVRGSMNAKALKRFSSIGAELWQISDETVEAAIARYRRDPRIKYVEPNYRVSLIQQRIERFPNDPRFAQMWGLHNTGQTGGTNDADIDAPEAWDIETGNDVIVGVIDTGVDWTHEDLAPNIWVNTGEIPNNRLDDDGNGYIDDVRGWDFVNNDNDPMDDEGHGSHVSGTIAAVGNNGIGTVGVSWSAKIMPLKFLDANGAGTTAGAIEAVEYATRMRARLTSNSWGSGDFSQALYDAIAAAGKAGILFVAAAGNGGSDGIGDDNDLLPHYPSNYDLDNIIAVAATDHNDLKAVFSNFGAATVDLGAPGVDILSTFPRNTYGAISGTSMATPHVSGAISLIWSRVSGLTHLRVKELILQNVDPLTSLQGRTVSGGRLNAFKALLSAEPDSIAPATVTDLATADPKSNFITLIWTASGDDGDSGKAAAYDIRYSTSPINSANFAAATRVSGAPAPRPAGDSESFAVGGLNFNTTYYFALKVFDEQGNASEASNSPSGTTLGIPVIAVTPDSLADSLLTGAQSTHTLTISNTGEGTLDFNIVITGADSLAVSAQINSFALNRARLKPEAVEQQESHRTQYEAYKDGASAGLSSPAQPVANPNMLELYRRFLATVADSAVIFHDDMENGVNGWSHYSTHANRIDQWAQTKNRANSGTTSWQVTQHDVEGSDALQSPPIDLTGYEDATLAFMHWHNFDDCGDPTFDPDGGILEVSSDGGARWTQIFPVGGYPYILDNTCSNPLTGYQAYSHDGGNGNAFIPAIFDLTPYAGNEILLRWQAGWDCGNCALNEGWYVDDVTVYSSSFIGWLSANPDAGTVVAGNGMAITVSFDATGLNGGDYAANLVISSNDPQTAKVKIPARLHVTGAPDIALSDNAFDFGTVLLGDTVAAKLTIANPGTDLLTANIVSDNGDYTVAPDLVNLAPKKSEVVLVRFIPSAEGDIFGALTIATNDPDEPEVVVALRGRGLPPPEIAVAPDSLRDNLLTGQTSRHVLTISNTGLSDLNFALSIENVAVAFPPELAKKRSQNLAAQARKSQATADSQATALRLTSRPEPPKQWNNLVKARPTNVTVTKPRKKNAAHALLPVVIEDPAGDGGAVDIITLRGLSIGDALQIEMEFATTIVPADFGGYFSVDIDQNPRTGFPPTFGLPGQDIGAEYEFSFFSLDLGVVDLFDLRTGVYVASYEVEIQPNTLRFSALLADLGKDDGNMDVTGVIGNAFGPTDWFPDQGHGTIRAGVTWISVAPDSGVVPPGSSVEIEVTFDATGLQGGDYTADLVVINNDPDEKRTIVPAHLQVTGAADIAAAQDTLDFGEVFFGVRKPLKLVVQNKGTLDLLILSAVTDPAVYTVSPAFAGVDPGEQEVFTVRFLPQAATDYPGTLTFTSNDPDEPAYVVTLLGQGVTPPDIEVSPPSFAFNLNAGDSAMAAMTIANTGGSTLDFTIRDEEAPRATPTGGQKLYWTEVFTSTADSVQRSNLDGSGVEKLFTTPNDPLGITIDVQGGRIYWAEFIDGSIRSSRLDGSDNKVLVSGLLGPVDIALDPAGGKMYWTDFNSGTITRANLDGSGVTIIVQSLGAASKNVLGPKDEAPATRTPIVRSDENALALLGPWGIALDLAHGKVYWAEQSGDRIARANLDGSNLETIIASGINGPRGIKLDVAAGKIYFVDSFNDAIKRANLDGGSVETILQFGSDRNTLDLELDLSAKQFYWSDNSAHLIQRANFDGSNVTSIISKPAAPAFEGFFGVGLLSGTNWLTERPRNGRIQADSTLGVDLEVNTKGLVDGDYSATVFIASNDPDEPEMPVPVTLHVTGVPVIAVSRDTLDYGAIFIGASGIDTLIVSNVGTALLSVTDISADLPEFKADATNFDLDPEERQVVVVTFKPEAVQEFSGQLTITSNDSKRPTVAVALLGKGVIPPDIAVAPDSLDESLFTGETSTQILTISNSGGSDLTFEISPAKAATAASVKAKNLETASIAASKNTFFKRQQDLSQLQQEISGQILAQTSSYGAAAQTLPKKLAGVTSAAADILLLTTTTVQGSVEQILKNMGRPYDFLQTEVFTGIDFSPYKTLIVALDGGLISEASVQALAIAASSGKKLIILGGTSVDSYYRGMQAYLLSHTGQQGWAISQTPHLRVSDPMHPLSADLPLIYNYNDFFSAYYMLRVNDPSAKAAAINGDGHPILLDKEIGDGILIYFTSSPNDRLWGNAPDFAILETVIGNALDFSGPITWLAVNPDFGIVPANDSINVVVAFDATGLKGGDYFANLVISSNDPDEDTLKVPAHLRVTGAPVIAVSDTILPFGEVFVGVTVIDTLIVSSRGTDSLNVSSIAVDNTDYSVRPTSFTLAPGENRAVEVSFTPPATGQSNGTLTILSNDKVTPQLQVTLAGEGVEPPVISVTPAAFEFRVDAGDSATALMTIANTGGSPLNFKIRDEEAPQTTAASDQKLYWAESLAAPDTLHRSNLDGNNVESLFTNNGAMRGIAVDEVSGRLYWTDRGDATIRSSRLDGSDVKVLLSGVDALDLAIDHAGGKIYWTNFSIGVINQANLDGSGVKIIIQRAPGVSGTRSEPDEEIAQAPAVRPDENAAVLGGPWGIALDLTHGKVYWTEQSGNRIGRANLDGSGVETVADSVLFGPRGIKLDVAGGKIYFIDSFNRAIKRANLDGSRLETIIPFAGSNPLDLELDVEAQQLYWTDNVLNQIQRVNFDGSNVQVIVNSNRANGPFGIGLSLGTGWLTEAPSSGTIAAGSSQDIEIKVDAGALANGNYSANIFVESNDPHPERKVVTVPVDLRVTAGDLLIAIADTLYGVPNETVDVPVFLTLNADSLAVAALGATIKATNKILAFVDFTPGPIIADTSLRVISPTPDSVRLAFLASSGQNITQSGLLATLRFQIANNAPVGQTALLNFSLLTAADSSVKPLSFSADNGRLKVNKAPVLSGRVQYAGTGAAKPAANLTAKLAQNGALVQETKTDADGNYVLANIIPGANYRVQVGRASGGIGAAITPTDALMALRASLSGAQKLAADVDGNLAVESKDAMMIFDFFLGLISQFPVEAWRTFPANYNIDATSDAWKIAPDGIDYPSVRNDLANQNYRAVVRGDVDLDWPPSAAASGQQLARLAGSSSGNSEALLQFTATNAVIVSDAKTMTWQVRLDGDALQKGVYAFGGELHYDASALEITQVRWGKLVPAEGFRLNYRILPAEKSETETITGRLRFGGFSTAAAAIREAGVLIEIDAQLRADLAAGASLPIRLSEVSAAVGASPGLSKSNGAGGGFTSATIAVIDGAVQVVAIPTDFALQNNYPNPFNPTTRIQYQLPEAAIVKLEIFNALGQRVRTLVNGGQQPAGYYNLEWNGRNETGHLLPSGLYFYHLKAKAASREFTKTHKMLMVK